MAKGNPKDKGDGAPGAAEDGAPETVGLSPDPRTNLLLADIALRGGGMLLRQGVARGILGLKVVPDKAGKLVKDRSLGQALVGTALAKVATRSVPGAILIGGGMIAKALFDRRKNRKDAEAQGEEGEAQES